MIWCDKYLGKVEKPPESPRHRIEPWRYHFWPVGVHKFHQATVILVAGPLVGGIFPLSNVSSGKMAQSQEVRCAFKVALLLQGERGQPRHLQALLGTLSS